MNAKQRPIVVVRLDQPGKLAVESSYLPTIKKLQTLASKYDNANFWLCGISNITHQHQSKLLIFQLFQFQFLVYLTT